jgi:hypothetical protein
LDVFDIYPLVKTLHQVVRGDDERKQANKLADGGLSLLLSLFALCYKLSQKKIIIIAVVIVDGLL